MIHRRFFLAIPLLVLGFLCSGALAQSPGDERGDIEHPGGAVGGLFNAPAPFRPGSLTGLMLGADGEAKFALVGVVFPGGPLGRGVLAGHATRLVGPHAGTKAPMVGVWIAGAGGARAASGRSSCARTATVTGRAPSRPSSRFVRATVTATARPRLRARSWASGSGFLELGGGMPSTPCPRLSA